MKNENPHMPDDFLQRAHDCLPANHPINEPRQLTQLQEAFLPALMWFFDTDHYRAQGRTHLLAHVAIKLAMQGNTIFLDDLHQGLTRPQGERGRSYFASQVLRLLDTDYKGHRFEYRSIDRSLSYRGQRPS